MFTFCFDPTPSPFSFCSNCKNSALLFAQYTHILEMHSFCHLVMNLSQFVKIHLSFQNIIWKKGLSFKFETQIKAEIIPSFSTGRSFTIACVSWGGETSAGGGRAGLPLSHTSVFAWAAPATVPDTIPPSCWYLPTRQYLGFPGTFPPCAGALFQFLTR